MDRGEYYQSVNVIKGRRLPKRAAARRVLGRNTMPGPEKKDLQYLSFRSPLDNSYEGENRAEEKAAGKAEQLKTVTDLYRKEKQELEQKIRDSRTGIKTVREKLMRPGAVETVNGSGAVRFSKGSVNHHRHYQKPRDHRQSNERRSREVRRKTEADP